MNGCENIIMIIILLLLLNSTGNFGEYIKAVEQITEGNEPLVYIMTI